MKLRAQEEEYDYPCGKDVSTCCKNCVKCLEDCPMDCGRVCDCLFNCCRDGKGQCCCHDKYREKEIEAAKQQNWYHGRRLEDEAPAGRAIDGAAATSLKELFDTTPAPTGSPTEEIQPSDPPADECHCGKCKCGNVSCDKRCRNCCTNCLENRCNCPLLANCCMDTSNRCICHEKFFKK